MKLSNDNVCFNFSKTNAPILRTAAPASVTIQTLDCFSNQLRREEEELQSLDWDRINPATGPIYVEGAMPGDTLKVTIQEINLDSLGTVCCCKGDGVLGHMLEGDYLHVVNITDNHADFLGKYKLPLRKMIGVIGVAPEEGAVNNGTPGRHGGNMDTTMITEGAVLYLPVFVEGALFGLGDVHSVMGDGEIGVSGLETPAEVKVKLEVIKGKAPEYPILENEDSFAVIVSKETVDEAINYATELMCLFLEERSSLSRPDIIMLMSLAGNVQISQVVDPEKTARFVFPKKYMDKKEF
ncbi:MAG: acetamidase [Coprococcus sp.]|nr:acetamidase [Coprococcus sp.]